MIPLMSLSTPQIGIRLKEEHTLAYVDNVCKGTGTLFITENDIVWINGCNEGFALKYPEISIFAVCTDHEKYPESCVFMLVQDENSTDEMECDSDFDEDFNKEAEIRFAPSEGTSVFDLFSCIQECNRLHSTENDDSSGDNDHDNDNNDEEGSGSDNGSHYEESEHGNSNSLLNGSLHESSMDHINGQFDDAE